MKKIIFAACLFFLAIPICRAEFSISQWKYFREISGIKGGLVKIALDDQVFTGSKKDLGDLRVVDSSNQETPFKLVVGKAEKSIQRFQPKLLNNSNVAGKFSTVILDFGSRGNAVNQLRIITSSENFQRNVKIYGSDDQQSWNLLKGDAYIYDYTDRKGNFKSQNATINFPESVFQYLKIEIADIENNPVEINSVETSRIIEEAAKEIERNPKIVISQNEAGKTSEIIADLESNGILTNKILISAADQNFNREVYIYSSPDKNEWKAISHNYIFKYNTNKFFGENLVLTFPETADKYLKIVVFNKDNAPLAISGIKTFSTYREMVFNAEAGKNYFLYYGNPKAYFPEYDIEKYWQYLEGDKALSVNISAQKDNPNFVPEKEPQKPVSERIPYLFPAILILASLALLFLVYGFFRNSKN